MRALSLSVVMLLGVAAALVSGYYLCLDWAALRAADARFEQLAQQHASLNALFITQARENVHRLNCFAEGVGVLLGGILAAIGLHGLCLLQMPAGQPRLADQ
jgi:hypothetical protein